VLLVVPPQFEAVESGTGVILHAQDAVGVEELFDLHLVAYVDSFHGLILHDLLLTYGRHFEAGGSRRHFAAIRPGSRPGAAALSYR
jgi:hypothetical protein